MFVYLHPVYDIIDWTCGKERIIDELSLAQSEPCIYSDKSIITFLDQRDLWHSDGSEGLLYQRDAYRRLYASLKGTYLLQAHKTGFTAYMHGLTRARSRGGLLRGAVRSGASDWDLELRTRTCASGNRQTWGRVASTRYAESGIVHPLWRALGETAFPFVEWSLLSISPAAVNAYYLLYWVLGNQPGMIVIAQRRFIHQAVSVRTRLALSLAKHPHLKECSRI